MPITHSRLSPDDRLARMREMFECEGGIFAEDYEHFTQPPAARSDVPARPSKVVHMLAARPGKQRLKSHTGYSNASL